MALPSLGNPEILGLDEGHHLPFADDTFDLVTSVDILEHIPNLPGFFWEVNRIREKGGRFYGNTPNRHWPNETYCRMSFSTGCPSRFVRTIFPKRLKKIEKLRWLDALNLQTPGELTELSGRYSSGRKPYAHIFLNLYRNDARQGEIEKMGERAGSFGPSSE